MKRFLRSLISCTLCLALLISVFPKLSFRASASNVTLSDLQAKFPSGKFWNHILQSNHTGTLEQQCYTCNNPDGWTDKPCYVHGSNDIPVGQADCNGFAGGWQCYGFANKLGYDAYGSIPRSSWPTVTNINTAISVVKPGDVIHYTGNGADASYGHWVFVYAVSGSVVTVGECNWYGTSSGVSSCNCIINWGRQINLYNPTSLTLYRAPSALSTAVPATTPRAEAATYNVGDEVLITWDAVSCATYYYVNLWNESEHLYSGEVEGTSFRWTAETSGNYSFYVEVFDTTGRVSELRSCSFTVETECEHDFTMASMGHPSNSTEGYLEVRCNKCDATKEMVIPILDKVNYIYEQTVAPTCTEKGWANYTWINQDYGVYTFDGEGERALGHDYVSQLIPATCNDLEKTKYTCTRCDDSYEEYSYSEWSTEYPTGVGEELIETKQQYRWRTRERLYTNEPLEGDYELEKTTWVEDHSGSVNFVDGWPSGFPRNVSLFTTYNNPVPKADETESTKREVGDTRVAGYIYWHFCRNTYQNGPIDREIEPKWTEEFCQFHGFFSTTDPSTLQSDSWGCHKLPNASCCLDSAWYYPLTVYVKDYTDYNKYYTYSYWSEWSDWIDWELISSYEHERESRTLYRYTIGEYGEHEWDDGVCTLEPTCTDKGQTTYTCTVCGATDVAEIEPLGHSYEATVTAPNCTEAGYTTYTCAACNESYVADETAALGHSESYTNNGANHTVGCDNCDYSAEENHSFTNGACVCGAVEKIDPILNTNLKFNMNIAIGAEMVVNYNFTAGSVGSYTDFYLEVKKNVAGGEPVITTYGIGENRTALGVMNHPATGVPLLYNASYTGIAAKEMGDKFETTLYAVAADGKVYCSATIVSSIKDFLISKINDASSIRELKTMAVDMLRYGAVAQVNFNYDVGNLVTNTLTKTQMAYATQGEPEATDRYSVTGTGSNVTASITVGSKVELSLSCISFNVSDPSNVKCVIMDEKGNVIATPKVNVMADVMFTTKYDNVGARQMREMIKAMFYDGDKLISKVTSWSVESYVAQTRANAKATIQEINLVDAMLTYGDAVAAYMTASGL